MDLREDGNSRHSGSGGAIERVIRPQTRDLGEMTVRRVLPARERKMVGPFIFLDQMGPAEFPPGQGLAVRPHPHIGIATITYLFEGEIIHRDSLGFVQPIRAGAVNLMAAGSGIVHSERAGDDIDTCSRLYGIQSWMALPYGQQEMAPEFLHYRADVIPEVEVDGATVRVIMGEACGRTSPVTCYSPTLYLECRLPGGSAITLPKSYEEMAAYVCDGKVGIDGNAYSAGQLLVARSGQAVKLAALQDSRVMVIGGDPVGERQIWWNFVASSKARIEQAKNDWREGRFPPVPGDAEFIPLPE